MNGILQTWDAISPESNVNEFKRCCISNAYNGSEDDVLWEEPVESKHTSDDRESYNSEAKDLCEE